MWDVIEHLPYPDLFIDKIASEQNSGGRIYITTGDIYAMIPKIKKEKWRLIHPPTHLHYFSKNSIEAFLSKKGYKVTLINYPSVYRSLCLIFYSLFILNKKEGIIASALYKKIPKNVFIPLNTFDIMFVVAEKK